VPRKRATDPATFYMMENKVTNQLFHEAMKDAAFNDLLKREGAKAPGLIKHEWRDKGAVRYEPKAKGDSVEVAIGSDNGRLPVMRVTVVEAHCFAAWLGGFLPTVQQWDKAAGRFEEDRGEGPFIEPWDAKDPQIAVGRAREGPMEAGQAAKDRSLFGCR